jgi:hypothetical protein
MRWAVVVGALGFALPQPLSARADDEPGHRIFLGTSRFVHLLSYRRVAASGGTQHEVAWGSLPDDALGSTVRFGADVRVGRALTLGGDVFFHLDLGAGHVVESSVRERLVGVAPRAGFLVPLVGSEGGGDVWVALWPRAGATLSTRTETRASDTPAGPDAHGVETELGATFEANLLVVAWDRIAVVLGPSVELPLAVYARADPPLDLRRTTLLVAIDAGLFVTF